MNWLASLFTEGSGTDTADLVDLIGADTIHEPEQFLSGEFNLLDPVESELLQDEVFTEGQPTRIKLSSLVPTESGQSVDRVRGLLETQSYDHGELSVYRRDGQNLLLDGHHRAIAASLDDVDSLDARMVKA